MPRVGSDSYHISKTPFVKYGPSLTENKYNIVEDINNLRYEELYNAFKRSFDYGARAYLKNIQNKEIEYLDFPYNNGYKNTTQKITLEFEDMEHCFGLPFKDDHRAKKLIKDLIEEYKKEFPLKNVSGKIKKSDRENLETVSNTIKQIKNFNLYDDSYNIQVNAICNTLSDLQKKYTNNNHVQMEILYQIMSLRNFMNLQNDVYYSNKEKRSTFFNKVFVEEASNIAIRDLANSPKKLKILNTEQKSGGTSELQKLIKLNLSSFGINLNNLEGHNNLIKKEKEIKNRVIQKLNNKYVKDIMTDEEIELNLGPLLIEDNVTGLKHLDKNYVISNMSRKTQKNFTGYKMTDLIETIKTPDKTKSIKEINDNIDSLIAVWEELERVKNTENEEDIQLVSEYADLCFLDMLTNKKYQKEMFKRSCQKDMLSKLQLEINGYNQKNGIYAKGIKNCPILKRLYGDGLNNSPIKDFAKEITNNDYISTEDKIMDIEISARTAIFQKDCHMNFDSLYNNYDIVEMIFYLTRSDKVKAKLKKDYLDGKETLNYKKIAHKAETIAEMGDMRNLTPSIRRTKEEIEKNGNIYKPKDNFADSTPSNLDYLHENNNYMFEFPTCENSVNLMYICYDSKNKKFKPTNILSDVNPVNMNEKKIIKAESLREGDYLATPTSYNNRSNIYAIIYSSPKYICSSPISVKNSYFNNLQHTQSSRLQLFKEMEEDNIVSKTEKEINEINKITNKVFATFSYADTTPNINNAYQNNNISNQDTKSELNFMLDEIKYSGNKGEGKKNEL